MIAQTDYIGSPGHLGSVRDAIKAVREGVSLRIARTRRRFNHESSIPCRGTSPRHRHCHTVSFSREHTLGRSRSIPICWRPPTSSSTSRSMCSTSTTAPVSRRTRSRERVGQGAMQVNGAAARLVQRGDTIIVVSYGHYDRVELEHYEPRVVHVEAHTNRIISVDDAVATLLTSEAVPAGTASSGWASGRQPAVREETRCQVIPAAARQPRVGRSARFRSVPPSRFPPAHPRPARPASMCRPIQGVCR